MKLKRLVMAVCVVLFGCATPQVSSVREACPSLLCRVEFVELRDANGAVRELRDDLQPAAHGFDEPSQHAHVHVRSVLDLRDLRLACAELLRKLLLRKLPSTT